MPSNKPDSKKISLTKTAVQLQKKLTTLTQDISIYNSINNLEDLKKISILCNNDYSIACPDGEREIKGAYLNEYTKSLPKKIKELKQLKEETKFFLYEVKHRAPHAFKIGKFSQIMRAIIDPKEITKTIDKAQSFYDYYTANFLNKPFESTKGGNGVVVPYSKIDGRFEDHVYDFDHVKYYSK